MVLFAITGLWAQEFKSDGLKYKVTASGDVGNTVMVVEDDYKSLTTVTIPKTVVNDGVEYTVTALGEYAFYECSNLTSVSIPNTVTIFYRCAFYKCSGLVSIMIPESVTSIGNGCFGGCTSLKSVVLPQGIDRIERNVFSECSSLASITIPEGVTIIEQSAFEHCESLTSVVIPKNVTSIEDFAFFFCSKLASVTMPKGLRSIKYSAFGYCSSLTSVTIPENVTSIGDIPFCYCSKLASISVKATTPPSLAGYLGVDIDIPVYVPEKSVATYKDANNWNKYNIIAMESGETDNGLSFVIISDTENTVEVGSALAGEYSGDIVIPEQILYDNKTYTVTGIIDEAFSGNASLTSVTIGGKELVNAKKVTDNPAAVKTRAAGAAGFIVGARAFKGCANLKSIILGDVVTGVGDEAFAGCTSLISVACEAANPPAASENTFDADTYRDAVLTVPEAFSAVYQTTNPWSKFAKVTTGIGSVTVENDALPYKTFQNGKLIIRKNGKSYNLQGAEIK